MSFCLNPECQNPENDATIEICQFCGSKLLLRDRYRAVRTLGQGGFGKTFLAIDQDRLNANCVIKQFLPQVQGTGALEKATILFNQEAVRLYELGEHPQIPSLLAYFTQEKRQYLVQDFIPGINLLKYLEEYGKFSVEQIWSLLNDLLPVLEFVHSRQVIHRDIKPENIIFRAGDNRFILIDFGVAKLLTANARTVTGTSIGTSGYVPLEQMEDGKVYPASDIYSLGVTCFHLLTGISPYSLFLKRGYSWLQDWQRYLPHQVSNELLTILNGMIQEDRYKRYTDAAAVLKVIENYDHNCQKLSQFTDRDDQLIEQFCQIESSRSVLIVETIDRLIAEQENKQTQDETFISDFTQEIDRRESQKIVEPTDEIFIAQFMDDISKGDSHQALESADETFISSFIQDINKNNELKVQTILPYPPVRHIIPADEDSTSVQMWRCIRTIRVHDQGVSYVAIKPNGQTLITAGLRRVIKSWDMDSGDPIATIIAVDTCASCGGLGKVPRDATVLFVKTRQLITCQDCAGFGSNSQNGERFWAARMSANGLLLAIASLDQVIKIWDLTIGKFSRVINTASFAPQIIAVSDDGNYLAYVANENIIAIYHLDRQIEVDKLHGHISTINCIDISPDGGMVVSGSEDGVIKLWNIGSNIPPLGVQGHRQGVNAIAISSNCMIVVSGGREGSVKVWNLATGHLIHTLKRHSAAISAITFNNDNITLATGSNDGLVCIWHLGRGELITTLEGHTDRITAIAASPSGQCFISSSLDSTIKIWSPY